MKSEADTTTTSSGVQQEGVSTVHAKAARSSMTSVASSRVATRRFPHRFKMFAASHAARRGQCRHTGYIRCRELDLTLVVTDLINHVTIGRAASPRHNSKKEQSDEQRW